LRAAAGAGAPGAAMDDDDDGAAVGNVDDGGISWVGSTAAAADRLDDDADVIDCPSPFSRFPINFASLHTYRYTQNYYHVCTLSILNSGRYIQKFEPVYAAIRLESGCLKIKNTGKT